MNKLKFLFLFLLINTFQSYGQDTDWKLEKEKDGIKIYTRLDNEIKFKEFRLEATINAPVEKLVATMNDVENYTEWMSDLKSVELVKKVNDEELITYSVIEVPFPFDNRDIVTVYNYSVNKNNGIVRIDMECMNDLIPVEEGLIRITIAHGFWEFMPQSADQTSIIYQFVADPGGSIPAWLTNMFLIEGPMKTVENLKEFVNF